MAFHAYPDPQTSPLNVAGGATSVLTPIVELSSVVSNLTTMFIRVVEIGGSCAPPGGADPSIILKADTGDEVTVPIGSTAVIRNQPGTGGIEVADAIMSVETSNVYLVRVFIFSSGISWQLRIKNNDSAAHDYTWDVASTDAEASQPWLDLPPTLSFDVLAKQSQTLTLQTANNGTGTLSFSDPPGTSLGSGFILTTVPGPIGPNACGDLQVTFTGPATPGTSTLTYTFPSNDQTAQTGGSHNNEVSLSAITRPPASGG